ncbi:MAG: VacJ family lipoprotein, partial [Verrucomicrobiota bacterium]
MRHCRKWMVGVTAGIVLSLSGASAQDEELMTDLPIGEDPSAQAEEAAKTGVNDPLEPVNRALYIVNDKLYFWVLKPAAKGYKAVVPKPPRRGIQNAFANIATPIRLVNCALQGDMQGTGTEFARFAINTTLGGLGLGDPADKKFGIKTRDEDTGQTLGAYGLGGGPYLMLPLLGPLTLRDGVGKVGDWFLDPINQLDLETLESVGLTMGETVNNTSLSLGRYEAFKKATVDPYTAIRSAYLKQRKNAVKDRG